MKPTKCPAREKKMSKKSEKRGEPERKGKVKVKTAVLLLNPKFCFLRMPELLHLDQKAVKCTTGKRVCDKFQLFVA